MWESPDPILGQYLNGQPNGGVYNPGNLGLYSYAYQNPIIYRDPGGQEPEVLNPLEPVPPEIPGDASPEQGPKQGPEENQFVATEEGLIISGLAGAAQGDAGASVGAIATAGSEVGEPPGAGPAAGEGASAVAVKKATAPIKAGSAGGEMAGKLFSKAVKDATKAENPLSTCVYCRREGTATQVDHAIPRVKGGAQYWTTHSLLVRIATHRNVREIFLSIRCRATMVNARPHIGREA